MTNNNDKPQHQSDDDNDHVDGTEEQPHPVYLNGIRIPLGDKVIHEGPEHCPNDSKDSLKPVLRATLQLQHEWEEEHEENGPPKLPDPSEPAYEELSKKEKKDADIQNDDEEELQRKEQSQADKRNAKKRKHEDSEEQAESK